MKNILLIIPLLLLLGCNNFPVDTAMSAFDGKDVTVPIEGCGNQPIIGFTYCRKSEGQVANDYISILGPKTNCERDEGCVYFKIFYPNGDVPAWGAWIPKDKMRAKVFWKDLLKSDVFTVGHRGYWPIKYWVYWQHPDGHEMVSETDGEIVVRVISKKYTPLHENPEDPNFAFTGVDEKGVLLRMTTGLRAYVKGK